MNRFWIISLTVFVGLLYGCAASPLDQQLSQIIEERGLTGDPTLGRDLPNIESPLAQLGMKLFFTKALGGEQDTACVTCHHPLLGGDDGLPMSIGVGADQPDLLGPSRTHPEGPQVGRNAPTTFNIGMWDQVLFHDGRVESLGKTPQASGNDGYGIHTPDSNWGYPDRTAGETLAEAQSRFPVAAEHEMRGFDFGTDWGNNDRTRNDRTRKLLAEIIGNYGAGKGILARNEWLSEFQAAFDSKESAETLITYENMAKAMAAYENSQIFVDTPWKAYVMGDTQAISESAKRGAILFFTPIEAGGADCARCHSGDFFTDEQFHALAIPQIGVGKDCGIAGDDDFGRYLETKNPIDKYAFRTPTLLNVEVTAPYGHNGAYSTLEEIVRHHLNPTQAIETYDFSQLDPAIWSRNAEKYTRQALAQLEENRANPDFPKEPLQNVPLSEEQITDLVNFLLTLTDPCVKDPTCLAPWILDEKDSDPDGLRIRPTIETIVSN